MLETIQRRATNYRPISLTSICCKILEHIIFTNIMNHFDYHSVLTDRQHGFRSKHSTESQLIITTHDLAQSLNNKLQVDMIIMDFSKAFDTVPHNRLLNKLNRYGIRNKTHNWISNFLSCYWWKTLHMDTSHFRCTSRDSTRPVTFSHLH